MNTPTNKDYLTDAKILTGMKLKALINSDLIAYTNSRSPIEAYILDGPYKGAILIGNATMDVATKRININFTKLRKTHSAASFDISGVVRDKNGDLGLTAVHESYYWQYFLSEVALNTASGIADLGSETIQTAQGFAKVPNLDNAAKSGISKGLSRGADKLGEKIRSEPEYVTARGPFVVSVIITD